MAALNCARAVIVFALAFGSSAVSTATDTAQCATARELVAALATSSVTAITLTGDVVFGPEDFYGWPSPLPLNRSVVVDGGPAQYELDGAYIRNKIQLLEGVQLTLLSVTLQRYRGKSISAYPGLDMIASSPPGKQGLLLIQQCLIVIRFCFPSGYTAENIAGMPRAEGYPGSNTVRRAQPQAGCRNGTSPAVRPPDRCWADVGVMVDLALEALEPDTVSGMQVRANYVMRVLDSPFACIAVLSEECMATFGPAGCITIALMRAASAPSPSPLPLPAVPAAAPAGTARSVLVPALVGSLGGAAVLAAVGLAAYLVVSRRQRRTRRSSSGSLIPGGDKGKDKSPSIACEREELSVGGCRTPAHDCSTHDPSCGKATASSGSVLCLPEALAVHAMTGSAAEAAGGLAERIACSVVAAPAPCRNDYSLGPECSNEVKLLPEKLGKGSYGRVVVGMFRGGRVAVKLIADADLVTVQGSTALLRSLTQEVEVLGRCEHPNVVRLLAASLEPPQPCLVMELMDGNLQRLLYGNPGKLLPMSKVLHIAAGIASGLAYLHPLIKHRDLKPANVLVTNAASSTPLVKIADFGLSRLRSTVAETRNPEVGTPSYMGPECFEPTNHRICHKVDIYALGVLIAEMLSGAQPWGGWTVLDVARSVVQGQRPPLLANLPPERRPARLVKLVVACWDQNPLRRPEAAEVARELLALQEGREQAQGQQGLARNSETGSIAIALDLPTLPSDGPSGAAGRALGETW